MNVGLVARVKSKRTHAALRWIFIRRRFCGAHCYIERLAPSDDAEASEGNRNPFSHDAIKARSQSRSAYSVTL